MEDEIADIAIYLLRLADVLGVDIAVAIRAKMMRNRGRVASTYP
jgi:NTP pyrophosphatase (non-canonical NTP hydrolase)